MSNTIRLAIVEDDPVLRVGLSKRLNSDVRFSCLDVFESGEELLVSPNLDAINVFLIDIDLPGMSGITAIERLRELDLPGQILMLTNFDDDDHIRSAILAGARGYLLKTTPRARLLKAIEEIHSGGAPLTSNVARIIMDYMASLPRPTSLDTLTDRERDVLALLADRKQYKEIADILFMSLDTVRSHVRGIYSKLNVHKRIDAEKIYRGHKS